MNLTNEQERVYGWYQQQAEKLTGKAEEGDGKLSEKDYWMHRYFSYPYFLLETDEVVSQSFVDILNNVIEIEENGKIGVAPIDRHKSLVGIYWGLQMEMNMRQTWPAVNQFTDKVKEYYRTGFPVGKRLFDNAGKIGDNVLVKFSKEKFVKSMYEKGEIRIASASYYENDAPESAMRDRETVRLYKVKALNEVLDGQSEIEIFNNTVPIKNGFIEVVTPVDDYYMFCTSTYFSRRMPTDFKADAALVITDKNQFIERVKVAVAKQLPDFEFQEGNVTYYDPCNEGFGDKVPEFMKHYSYTYQQEHRCIFRSKRSEGQTELEDVFLQLGSISDISRPVYL